MTFLNISSLLSFSFYFTLIITHLLICCCAGKVGQQQSSRGDLINLKSSVDYEEEEAIIEQDKEGKQVKDDRGKRALEVDSISRKVIMLMVDKDKGIHESYEDIMDIRNSSFTINDFIIRMQEKYEDTICRGYLESAKGVIDNYFTIPEYDLVHLPNDGDTQFKGDEYSRKKRKDRAADPDRTKRRFKFYGEECNPTNEWYFWRDMFVTAENDTRAEPKGGGNPGGGGGPPGPPGPPPPNPTTNGLSSGEFVYVTVGAGEMMGRFNAIWEKYKTKGICNPKYLLECDEKNKTCKCRTKGIGLPTVVTQRDEDENDEGDTPDYFTTQYYEDLRENDKGKTKIHHGQYVHKKKCVVTANLPGSNLDIYITNPCDFFLPMIGLCRADCVENATCRSVTGTEKEAMRARSSKQDFFERIRIHRLHEVYHQKCVCDTGKICRKITSETYGDATTVKSTLTLSFTFNVIFIFQIIGTDNFAKY